jgi:hypothetical protein
MDVNENARILEKRVALESFASNRASTGCSYRGIGGFERQKSPGDCAQGLVHNH